MCRAGILHNTFKIHDYNSNPKLTNIMTTRTEYQYVILPITIEAHLAVIIKTDNIDKIEPEHISKAVDQLDHGELRLGKISDTGTFMEVPPDEVAKNNYNYLTIPDRSKSIADRAEEIGVSRQCLTVWKNDGIDIYDDEEVRRKIALCPRWLPQVKELFKIKARS